MFRAFMLAAFVVGGVALTANSASAAEIDARLIIQPRIVVGTSQPAVRERVVVVERDRPVVRERVVVVEKHPKRYHPGKRKGHYKQARDWDRGPHRHHPGHHKDQVVVIRR